MRLQVNNLRSIAAADLAIPDAQVLLLTGPNGAGKSTLCTALAATLGSPELPIAPGRSRETRARHLVREGEDHGAATLTADGWQVRCAWPSEEVTTKGRPPVCSELALGTVRLGALPAKDRAAALIRILGLSSSRDELQAAMQAAGCADRLDEVWRDLESTGQDYDALAREFADAATKAKVRWELVTRQKRWGQRLAETWRPEGFADVDRVSMPGLERELAAAQLALSDARVAVGRRQAVAEAAAADLSRIPELETELVQLEKTARLAKDAWEAQPAPVHDRECRRQPCPECGAEIAVLPSGKLRKIAADDATEPDLELAIQGERRVMKAKLFDEMQRCKEELAVRKAELERLRKLAAKAAEPYPEGPTVDEAEAAHDAARLRRAAKRQALDAAAAHETVREALAIAQILGPDGIRAAKTKTALHVLNAELLELVEGTAWPIATIDENLEVGISTPSGLRLYSALSPSEKWKADALAALALARRNGDALVILDGADVVAGIRARNDMLTIAGRAGRGVVLAMASADRTKMPDLAAMGRGVTLWVEGGRVQSVEARREAA